MDHETPTEKPCSKCRQVKPLNSFKKQATGKYGRTAACNDCANEQRRAAYARDPERHRAKLRERYAADPGKARARTREWRANNREQARASSRAGEAKRRAIILGATTGPVDEALARLSGADCYLCHEPLPQDRSDGSTIHLDHVIPLARGGQHCMSNLRPVHATCNLRKGDRLLSELDWFAPVDVDKLA